MQLLLTTALSLHVLASVFWAGSTFALARTGGAQAAKLFAPQMGAFAVALLSGAYLWHAVHGGVFGTTEKLLATGALCALAAAAGQATMVGSAIAKLRRAQNEAAAQCYSSRAATAHRIAAVLLAVAAICMAASRYGL